MSSLIALNPLKGSSSFKPGTKIFFTVGNQNKVYESILFQFYTTISPPFKAVAVILKKWVTDLNDTKAVYGKGGKVKIQFKWITLLFVLIHYMQTRGLLPVLA